MAGKINVYDLAGGGVNLTKGAFHLADNEVVKAQNAELVLDTENGGEGVISKRGGYLRLNSTALAGPVLGMTEVRFIESVPETFSSVPISEFFNTPGGGTITAFGAATTWEAVASEATASYVEMVVPILDVGAIVWNTTTPIVDPGIDTDHYIRVIARVTLGSVAPEDVGLYLYANGTLIFFYSTALDTLTGSFTEILFPIPEVDVATFRSNSGYTVPQVGFAAQSLVAAITLEVAFIELVVPSA